MGPGPIICEEFARLTKRFCWKLFLYCSVYLLHNVEPCYLKSHIKLFLMHGFWFVAFSYLIHIYVLLVSLQEYQYLYPLPKHYFNKQQTPFCYVWKKLSGHKVYVVIFTIKCYSSESADTGVKGVLYHLTFFICFKNPL